MTTYIPDGYTRDDGYIAESEAGPSGERLWSSLEFTYRPAARTENVRHDAEVTIALRDEYKNPECAVKAEKLACEFVARRIVTWNLKDAQGNDIPLSPLSCERINAGLFQRLYTIIRGSSVSDPKPGSDKSPSSDVQQQKN